LKFKNKFINNLKKIINKVDDILEYTNNKFFSKLDLGKYILFFTFFCVFISPTTFLENIFNIDITKYIFLVFSILTYTILICLNKKISKTEILMIVTILCICVVQKSIVPLSLIELILIFKSLDMLIIQKTTISKRILIISIVGIVFYSLIYFNYNGRFLYTGLKEINQSGFAILMLAILVRSKNKKIGNIILALGLLTFSRNYMLGMLVYLLLEFIKKTNFYSMIYNFFSFKNLTIVSILFLIIIAGIFEFAYSKDKLVEYKEGFSRYIYIFDYSNYFRFSVNTNLIQVYVKHPEKLLTGIEEEEFIKYSCEISQQNNRKCRSIKPHNYFFSYMRIYGLFSIIIFIFLNSIFKKIITKNNFSVFVTIFVYASLLGIGFANYWLFLTIFTLLAYKDERSEKDARFNYSNKNISEKKCVD